MSGNGFWDDPAASGATVAKLKSLKTLLEPFNDVISTLGDIDAMFEMAEESDADEVAEILVEVTEELTRLESLLDKLETAALLSGPNDDAPAILSINARDGGTDANDWAEMLLKMYIAWAQSHGHKAELLDRQDNEEAGINSATVVIRGPYAYGYLKGESGMHRLVRISPFNSEGKRQTSFAAVDVSPEINSTVNVELVSDEIRTHIPTGIVVQCQNDRSQHKNRATAQKMLLSRLARVEEEKREAEQAAKYNEMPKVGFGSQIRNYFLHPDQRVKDARTGYYVGSFNSVLSGEIDGFLEAFLRWRVQKK